jgi:hypothetical protein
VPLKVTFHAKVSLSDLWISRDNWEDIGEAGTRQVLAEDPTGVLEEIDPAGEWFQRLIVKIEWVGQS